jgi:fermentation-respiration switch protein FrsA (DUF1100 family)
VSHSRFSRGYWFRLAKFGATVTAIAAVSLLLYFGFRQFQVFVTPRRVPLRASPAQFGLAYKPVSFVTRDGLEIKAWYIPGWRPVAVILVHGINANREAMFPTAVLLAEAGYPLLLLDLRGHGESDGDRVTYGYYEALDVQAAVEYLANQPQIRGIAALGTSMGGAPVVRAASLEPRLQAIIVQSSYSNLPDAIDDAYDQWSIFPRWPFAMLFTRLGELYLGLLAEQVDLRQDLRRMEPRPLLIIHGRHDQLFPVRHAKEMYEAASEPKTLWIIEDIGHQDPVKTHQEAYRDHLSSFLMQAFQSIDDLSPTE